ncbi:MAG TPA: PsbP-related protein [Chthoniobacteraceae bacterium]|jgi:hypothetical protein
MFKSLFTLLAVASLTVLSAEAKSFKLPAARGAVATIAFPDDWKVEAIEGGHGGNSADEHVYLSAVVVKDETDMNASLESVFEMLKEHNVELDETSKKETKFDHYGTEASELTFSGKDKDGPTTVSIAFVPMNGNLVILTYWVTTAEEEKHQVTVGKIVNSLKPVK